MLKLHLEIEQMHFAYFDNQEIRHRSNFNMIKIIIEEIGSTAACFSTEDMGCDIGTL